MDENKQAILLLSTYFSSPKRGEPTPLTSMEYGRFAYWLRNNELQPKDLFHKFDEVTREWVDTKGKITPERMKFLIGRGMAMGMALEKWQSAGIWVITRSDPDYPLNLKKRLNENAPALLFGVGNKQILSAGGLAMVGSRNIDSIDQQYTGMVAQQAAKEGLNVVSGGARGVDETAMLASLEAEGATLGVLANDLLKAAISNKWRAHLKSGQLVLISTVYPEASFNPGNAMGRNKYIYCLSDYALAVRSSEGSGGTWAGATENLKKKWVPLFVKGNTEAAGNHALIKLGAMSLNAPKSQGQDWLLGRLKNKTESDVVGNGLELITPSRDKVEDSEAGSMATLSRDNLEASEQVVEEKIPSVAKERIADADDLLSVKNLEQKDLFYRLFIKYFEHIIAEQNQISLAELKLLRQDLTQQQMLDWLGKAVEEGLIDRKGKKHIYMLKVPDLFSDK